MDKEDWKWMIQIFLQLLFFWFENRKKKKKPRKRRDPRKGNRH